MLVSASVAIPRLKICDLLFHGTRRTQSGDLAGGAIDNYGTIPSEAMDDLPLHESPGVVGENPPIRLRERLRIDHYDFFTAPVATLDLV
jgi:hypothetical protein